MCGIAGIFFKDGQGNRPVGHALVDMLDGCQHRGPDSTGFALYGAGDDHLVLRFLVGEGPEREAAIERIRSILSEFAATPVEEQLTGVTWRVTVAFAGDIQAFAYALERGAKLLSVGRRLDIIKDCGTARDVDRVYGISGINGTHGIGHVRLATESDVRPEAAHPFWATGFADVAIVHNGQITNYYKMRRPLEQRDFEFRTENDSELIAVYLADQLRSGASLNAALERAVEDLDGTFSFLVATGDGLGCAKDKLAAKPMVMMETDELVAIASEEVSLNRLFPGRQLNTSEPPPGSFATWSRSILP